MQDDWAVNDRLTMNVGVRWDVEINAFANAAEVLPFLKGGRPHDWNNIGPRLGFTYSLNDETVIRGGGGVYFGTTSSPYQTLYAPSAHKTRFSLRWPGRLCIEPV